MIERVFGIFLMVLVMFVGGILGYMIGKPTGAIAAHKGEIVCVQLAFKNE